jgi:hypothetical protein
MVALAELGERYVEEMAALEGLARFLRAELAEVGERLAAGDGAAGAGG